MTHAQKSSPVDMKIATIKPRPSSRCLVTQADINVSNTLGAEKCIYMLPLKKKISSHCVYVTFFWLQSLYHDRQGVAVVPPTVPGTFLGLPEKGTIKKQKSIGTVCMCVCVHSCVHCGGHMNGLILDRCTGLQLKRSRLIMDEGERSSQQSALSGHYTRGHRAMLTWRDVHLMVLTAAEAHLAQWHCCRLTYGGKKT